MSIADAVAVPGVGGYFTEDLAAIRAGAVRDGFIFTDDPVSAGFRRIMEPSEAISIILRLDDGSTVFGDAVTVDYAGVGGRSDRLTWASHGAEAERVCGYLTGREVASFRTMCMDLEKSMTGSVSPAVLYGASQALLQAVALRERLTCAEVLTEEYGLTDALEIVPLYIQTGDERYRNVDKAILKRVAVLPHGLINDAATTVGADGGILREYVSWIRSRIRAFGADGYRPSLHFDVYGTIGEVFENDAGRIADYLGTLEKAARPFPLYIETPVLMSSRSAQIETMSAVRRRLNERGIEVAIIADEWANSLEDIREFLDAGASDLIGVKTPDLGAVTNAISAVLECRRAGIGAVLGGSCSETDQCARVIAQVALAVQPTWVLARPGMGVDEGLQIMHNEMQRALALMRVRDEQSRSVRSTCPANPIDSSKAI